MNSNSNNLEKNAKGFILVLTLFTALILGTLVVGFLLLTAVDLNLVKNHMCSLQAYYVAKAGIADAIDKIQRDALATNEWENYFPEGATNRYHVVVTSSPTIVVTSTGVVPTANFSSVLEARVKVISDAAPYKVSVKHFKEVIQ